MSKQPLESPVQVQIVAGAIMASVIVHAVVGVWLTRGGVLPEGGLMNADENTLGLIGLVLVAAGAGAATLSFLVRRLLVQRLQNEGATLQSILQAVIVSLAMAEAPGVMGLVLALLTGGLLLPAVLWGISFGVSLFHFPTRAWIENLLDGGRH